MQIGEILFRRKDNKQFKLSKFLFDCDKFELSSLDGMEFEVLSMKEISKKFN